MGTMGEKKVMETDSRKLIVIVARVQVVGSLNL